MIVAHSRPFIHGDAFGHALVFNSSTGVLEGFKHFVRPTHQSTWSTSTLVQEGATPYLYMFLTGALPEDVYDLTSTQSVYYFAKYTLDGELVWYRPEVSGLTIGATAIIPDPNETERGRVVRVGFQRSTRYINTTTGEDVSALSNGASTFVRDFVYDPVENRVFIALFVSQGSTSLVIRDSLKDMTLVTTVTDGTASHSNPVLGLNTTDKLVLYLNAAGILTFFNYNGGIENQIDINATYPINPTRLVVDPVDNSFYVFYQLTSSPYTKLIRKFDKNGTHLWSETYSRLFTADTRAITPFFGVNPVDRNIFLLSDSLHIFDKDGTLLSLNEDVQAPISTVSNTFNNMTSAIFLPNGDFLYPGGLLGVALFSGYSDNADRCYMVGFDATVQDYGGVSGVIHKVVNYPESPIPDYKAGTVYSPLAQLNTVPRNCFTLTAHPRDGKVYEIVLEGTTPAVMQRSATLEIEAVTAFTRFGSVSTSENRMGICADSYVSRLILHHLKTVRAYSRTITYQNLEYTIPVATNIAMTTVDSTTGDIFVACRSSSGDSYVYCLNGSDLSFKWSWNTARTVEMLAIDTTNQRVFVTCLNGGVTNDSVFCLDYTGGFVWGVKPTATAWGTATAQQYTQILVHPVTKKVIVASARGISRLNPVDGAIEFDSLDSAYAKWFTYPPLFNVASSHNSATCNALLYDEVSGNTIWVINMFSITSISYRENTVVIDSNDEIVGGLSGLFDAVILDPYEGPQVTAPHTLSVENLFGASALATWDWTP